MSVVQCSGAQKSMSAPWGGCGWPSGATSLLGRSATMASNPDVDVPTNVGLSLAAVAADVEASPVLDRRSHRGSLIGRGSTIRTRWLFGPIWHDAPRRQQLQLLAIDLEASSLLGANLFRIPGNVDLGDTVEAVHSWLEP